jgi:endonuclease YncB( thermonuclease family)
MARNMARTLVQERLLAPGTARWVAEKILERDKYGRYLVHVVVDSQNAFGAPFAAIFLWS